MDLKIKKVKDNAKIPKIATSGAAGMDLYACITEKITVEPQKIAVIPTGIAIELPNPSVAAFVYARSGLGIKHGICLANGVGVIDSDYRAKSASVFAMFRINLTPSSRLKEWHNGDCTCNRPNRYRSQRTFRYRAWRGRFRLYRHKIIK